MSDIEHSDSNRKTQEPKRGSRPLATRLQASLDYRTSHPTPDQAPENRLIALVDLPEENSEIYFDPSKSGLVCDAPLGLKR